MLNSSISPKIRIGKGPKNRERLSQRKILFPKKYCVKNSFWPKDIVSKKKFGQEKIQVQKTFLVPKN